MHHTLSESFDCRDMHLRINGFARLFSAPSARALASVELSLCLLRASGISIA